MSDSNIFKGQQKPTPKLGTDAPTSGWWTRPQWQAGQVPEGFNPVYRAGATQPPNYPESTPNFAIRKKAE
jgi:hypothetical protein